MRKLETLLDDLDYGQLPPEWTAFDLETFSRAKRLWDYQQTALRNAIKGLWRYYGEPGEADTNTRKQRLSWWYQDNGIHLADAVAGKAALARLLGDYYPIENGRLPYEQFINRMGFWMATGSGKTLVIVKLIEVLRGLMARGLIPQRDVLVLTHREDLLRQIREHVAEFNTAGLGIDSVHIRLRDLKEYPEVKREFPSLLTQDEMTVFTYRSDNLSDEQKERIIDFRNYDNDGRWYVLLDEAHKGDKDDSKRQHIYSILSRDGFLFNFSATFTDDRDVLTTAAEFNLASFIARGYGKHIAVMRQEMRVFDRKEDYSDDEKQRIVLQSLLMLAFITRLRAKLNAEVDDDLYHRPLLITLVNSVNTEDADLKHFFTQLARIARGTLGADTFARAKADLLAELQAEPQWLYERERYKAVDLAEFNTLTLRDVLRLVFNADSHGGIEVLTRPSNDKELAFKLKSADAPFALIRIGNTAEWLRNYLVDYEIVQGFTDESFFAAINRDDSTVNLLMGSRSFYEGWDSNRPNVITFINIGVGADAKKFILQSVGRGVRIEPLRGQRRRLLNLLNSGAVDRGIYERLTQPYVETVESLFIFGTNRSALESVLDELEQAQEKAEGHDLPLAVNEAAAGRLLLIPTYRREARPLLEEREPRKFEIAEEDRAALKREIDYLGDRRLLMARYGLRPQQIALVNRVMAEPGHYFNTIGARRTGRNDVNLARLVRYLNTKLPDWEGFKPLDDEINHFQYVRVVLKEIEELRRKVAAVQAYRDPEQEEKVLAERYEAQQMTLAEYTNAIKSLARAANEAEFTPPHGATLRIKHLAAHYYVPLLLSTDEKIDYINHVIKVRSEVQFINQLESYLAQPDNLFQRFDWWMFSRTVERVDRVTIPYYDRGQSENRVRDFYPDFIFWLQHGRAGYGTPEYTILFVDPKGTKITDYENKVDGFVDLFVDESTNRLRVFSYGGMKVRVALVLFTDDAHKVSRRYRPIWSDQPEDILKKVLEETGVE